MGAAPRRDGRPRGPTARPSAGRSPSPVPAVSVRPTPRPAPAPQNRKSGLVAGGLNTYPTSTKHPPACAPAYQSAEWGLALSWTARSRDSRSLCDEPGRTWDQVAGACRRKYRRTDAHAPRHAARLGASRCAAARGNGRSRSSRTSTEGRTSRHHTAVGGRASGSRPSTSGNVRATAHVAPLPPDSRRVRWAFAMRSRRGKHARHRTKSSD